MAVSNYEIETRRTSPPSRRWPRFEQNRSDVGRREDVIAYLRQIDKILTDVSYTRGLWRSELDAALKLIAQGKLIAGLAQAARIGHTYESSFADHHRAIVEVRSPLGAERYHSLLLSVMEQLSSANACLARAATHKNAKLLSECGQLLRQTKQKLSDLEYEKRAMSRRCQLEDV